MSVIIGKIGLTALVVGLCTVIYMMLRDRPTLIEKVIVLIALYGSGLAFIFSCIALIWI